MICIVTAKFFALWAREFDAGRDKAYFLGEAGLFAFSYKESLAPLFVGALSVLCGQCAAAPSFCAVVCKRPSIIGLRLTETPFEIYSV